MALHALGAMSVMCVCSFETTASARLHVTQHTCEGCLRNRSAVVLLLHCSQEHAQERYEKMLAPRIAEEGMTALKEEVREQEQEQVKQNIHIKHHTLLRNGLIRTACCFMPSTNGLVGFNTSYGFTRELSWD